MRTGLWMIPLQPHSQPTNTTTPQLSLMAMAANVASNSTTGNHAPSFDALLMNDQLKTARLMDELIRVGR
jgi:hypothetical protein